MEIKRKTNIMKRETQRLQEIAGIRKPNLLKENIEEMEDTLSDLLQLKQSGDYLEIFDSLEDWQREVRSLKQKISDYKEDSIDESLSQEYLDRIEGLANIEELANLKNAISILASDWLEDGFEKEDILDYLETLI